ncbi:MAG: hypothetical protein R6X35_12570, partial [Candidatus Krumholzibacteriia bacterium]
MLFGAGADYASVYITTDYKDQDRKYHFWGQTSTGQFVFNSYMEEGFFFLKPKFFHGLFSYRKGWLVYSPVMTMAIIGFIWMRYKVSSLFFPLLL